MITTRIHLLFLLALVAAFLGGCAGTQTFTTAARAGDTVMLPLGWQKTLLRQNITVTITPSSGSPVVYAANNPAVRGLINLYPDPISKAVIGTNLNNDLGVSATATGSAINSNVTGNDSDWWQTNLFLDLPSTLPSGVATIAISNATTNAVIQSSTVNVLPGAGSPNNYNVYSAGGNHTVGSWNFNVISSNWYPNALLSLERAQHVTLTFGNPASAPTPQALQVQLSHDPSTNQSWVVNPRGDIKNVSWRDNGTTITLLITAASGSALNNMKDLKVYIAGPVTGIAVIPGSLKTYDSNGGVITGITTALAQ